MRKTPARPLFHPRIVRGLLVACKARGRTPIKRDSTKPKEEEKA